MKRIVPICLLFVAAIVVIRVFAVERVIPATSGGDLVLRWPGGTGEVYVVLWTDELGTNTVWTALVTNHPAATGTNETSWTHTGALLDKRAG